MHSNYNYKEPFHANGVSGGQLGLLFLKTPRLRQVEHEFTFGCSRPPRHANDGAGGPGAASASPQPHEKKTAASACQLDGKCAEWALYPKGKGKGNITRKNGLFKPGLPRAGLDELRAGSSDNAN